MNFADITIMAPTIIIKIYKCYKKRIYTRPACTIIIIKCPQMKLSTLNVVLLQHLLDTAHMTYPHPGRAMHVHYF